LASEHHHDDNQAENEQQAQDAGGDYECAVGRFVTVAGSDVLVCHDFSSCGTLREHRPELVQSLF
jgi:hypothetical protein